MQSFCFLSIKVCQLLILIRALSLSVHKAEVMTGHHMIFITGHLCIHERLLHIRLQSIMSSNVVCTQAETRRYIVHFASSPKQFCTSNKVFAAIGVSATIFHQQCPVVTTSAITVRAATPIRVESRKKILLTRLAQKVVIAELEATYGVVVFVAVLGVQFACLVVLALERLEVVGEAVAAVRSTFAETLEAVLHADTIQILLCLVLVLQIKETGHLAASGATQSIKQISLIDCQDI